MITAEQERNLSDANARAKKKQDRVNPMVVNIEDGRLMPNTPRLRVHPNYRVYGGPKDATATERLKWLEGQSARGATKLVNSKEAEDVFDVGTATLEEMQMFALENFGMTLDTSKPMKVIRKELMAAAEKAEKAEAAARETAGADLT